MENIFDATKFVNFGDGKDHIFEIVSKNNEQLLIYIDNKEDAIVNINFSISKNIQTETGCAWLGITQESKSANNHLDISKWEYKINQISNIRTDIINNDLWDLLSLEYKPK